jgi:putative colanic acid biosynthesis acetyltransferase WcaF
VDFKPKEGSRIRNDWFSNRHGFDLGRPRFVFVIWYIIKCVFFLSSVPWPSRFKSWLLRRFGAEVGQGVYWKPRVNVHIPWKLKIGDHTWVGEEVCIVNFASVTIGSHCCLSQRSFVCSGNHDYRSPDMRYRHAPIVIEDGVWVGAGVFVGPGSVLGTDTVVTAMSVVNGNLEPGWVYSGHPCKAIRRRWQME